VGALLAGVRVLDLTNVLAGPFATYQLALLGAVVVMIAVPGSGDLARSLGADPALAARRMGISFLAVNAGKKSITLNLKSATGRDVFLRLAKDAHVVVEAFRPGVMERLGLDFESVKAVNPAIVYCAISGFGQTGPLAARPAYDQIIQGYSGVMSVTGDAKSAPLRTGHPVTDTTGGLTAAMAICAALVRAKQSGEGAFIDEWAGSFRTT
jgi:formyl-CoA transferase